jgi:hypothetical protein
MGLTSRAAQPLQTPWLSTAHAMMHLPALSCHAFSALSNFSTACLRYREMTF